jgi:hypothetical protein
MELIFNGKLTKNEMRRFQFGEFFSGPVTIFYIVGLAVVIVAVPTLTCLLGYCSIFKYHFRSDFIGLGISSLGLAFFIACAIFFGSKEAAVATTVRLTPTSVSIDTPGHSQVTVPADKVRLKFHRLGLACRSGRTVLFILPYRVLSKDDATAIKNMYGLK